MFRLALRTLRFRTGAFVASFIALALGTVIVTACAGLLETGIRTDVPAQRLVAAPIVVTGGQDNGPVPWAERVRVPASLADRIAAVPGVAHVVTDVSFPALPLRDGHPVVSGTSGHGWASTALSPTRLVAGTAPDGPGQVVLGARVAAATGDHVGDRVTVAVAGRATDFRISGVLAGPAVGNALFYTDAEADTLLGRPGDVDSVAVLPVGGTDVASLDVRISLALAGTRTAVLTGDTRGQAEFPDALLASATLIPVAAVLGGLATCVAMFVVAGTLGLSLQQRQREMALLRAIGTTPRQLRRMVVGEAAVVSGLAVLVAFVPGVYLGQWMLGQLSRDGIAPSVIEFRDGWISMVSAVGIMLFTALAAAFIAARRSATTRPTEALAEAALQRRWLSWVRLSFAVLCLGGGLALAIVTVTVMPPDAAASTAEPSAMLWAAGFALLGPGLTGALVAVFRWPVRALSGMAGHLAIRNALSRRVRLAAAVSPVMLLSGLATAMVYFQTTQTASADQAFVANLRADAVLVSSTGGMPTDLVDSVATLPGVGAATSYVPSTVYHQGPPEERGSARHPTYHEPDMDDYPLVGVTGATVARTMSVDVSAGSLDRLDGNTVALSTGDADSMGTRIGGQVTLYLGDGTPVNLRVVALLSPPRGADEVLMPADLVAAHTTNALVPQILVRAAPGTDPTRLRTVLAGFARAHVGVGVADRAMVSAQHASSQQTSAWVTYLFAGVITVYSILALINTLIIATLDRRREFALQRLVGAGRGQVLRMMGVESALVALVGIVLGTLVSIATLVPFSITATNSPVPTGPVAVYLVVVAGTAVLVACATLIPAWAALPRKLSGALGTRE